MGKNVLMIAVMAVFLAVFGAFYLQDQETGQNEADQSFEVAPVVHDVHTEKPQQKQVEQKVKISGMPPQPREPKPLAPAMSGDLTIFDQDMPPQP